MRTVVLLALVVPLAASAQTATDEPVPSAAPVAAAPAPTSAARAAAPSAPAWSIGAGVGFSSAFLVGTPSFPSPLTGVYLAPPMVPVAAASLERRISGRSWLVLGVSGSFAHESQDVPPDRAGVKKSDSYALALSAGVRRVLTPAGAPVDVSILALAQAGATRWKGDAAEYDYGVSPVAVVDTSVDEWGWRAGGSLGLAVDRTLTGSLSLRLSTPLVGAWYTRTTTKATGHPTLDGDEVAASFVIAPSLELRLAF